MQDSINDSEKTFRDPFMVSIGLVPKIQSIN